MVMRVRDGVTGALQFFDEFFNGTAETVPTGAPVCLDSVVNDGVYVRKPVTADLSLFVGVADQDAAPGTYFRVQTRGFRAAGALITGSSPVAVGDILSPENGQWRLIRVSAGDGKSGYVIACEIYSVAATALKKVYIRGA